MAAITLVAPILSSPVAYESAQHGYAGEDLEAGDLVVISAAGPDARWDVTYEVADGATADGIVLKDCGIGGTADVAYQGEMDGYSGLTPGARLSVASGVIDATAPVQADTAAATSYTITAVTASRIKFRFG